MKITVCFYRIIYRALFFSFAIVTGHAAQTNNPPEKVARSIAARIISETSLKLKPVPLQPLSDIQVIDFGPMQAGNPNSIFYACSEITVSNDTILSFGLSCDLPVKIWLNSSFLFESAAARTFIFKEYGYNKYSFNDTLKFSLHKGSNRILVKGAVSDAGDVMFLNELITPGSKITAQFSLGANKNSWQYNGPYAASEKDALHEIFPPENSFAESYNTSQGSRGWVPPLERSIYDIEINQNAVYKRESYAEWTYPNGTVLLSLLSLSEALKDTSYSQFVRHVIEFTLSNMQLFKKQYEQLHALRSLNYRIFRCGMLDDTGAPILPYLQWSINTGDNSYNDLISRIAGWVTSGQVRLKDSTLCRPEDKPMTVWADDLFMSVPCLLRMGKKTGLASYYNDAAKQICNFNRYLIDKNTGLYHHAYYDFKNEQSPVLWGRANGWVIWAESEALLLLPENHPEYLNISRIFKNHMESLLKYQGKNGLWHQVLDHPDSFEETSCTAMFLIGMVRGMRLGILDRSCTEAVKSAWKGLQTRISNDGVVKDICRGTGISDSFEFYYNRERFENDPRGLGAVITAAVEMMSVK